MVSLIALLISIESTIFIIILITRDCYTRKLQDNISPDYGFKRFASWDHLAFLEIFLSSLCIIWFNLIYNYTDTNIIYRITTSISLAVLFQCDWIHASGATANFLNPFKPKNIYARIVYYIFGCISLANVIMYILSGIHHNFDWHWNRYILTTIILYCIVSFGLETQFFIVTYNWCFVGKSGDSTMRGGIYGFLKHFSKIIWRLVFVFIKSMIIIVFIVFQFWKYNVLFWQCIVPFCLQLWCLGLFLLRLSNRPVLKWKFQTCYRKLVEYWYDYAGRKAKERNKTFPIQRIRWEIPKQQNNTKNKTKTENEKADEVENESQTH
eukprot:421589_1